MSPPWAIWGLNRGAQLAKISDPDWPIIVLAPAASGALLHPPAQQPINCTALALSPCLCRRRPLRGADLYLSFKPPPPQGACLTPFLL